MAVFLVETPSDCCLLLLCYSVRCSLCCPVPCQVDGAPPYSCHSASAALPHVPILFCFCDLLFRFFTRRLCSPVSPFGLWSLVSPFGPTSWTYIGLLVFNLFSSVSALFLSCLPSGLIASSFCWSINLTCHRTGADYPTYRYWVSILYSRIVECGIHVFFFGQGPLGRGGLICLASLP